MLEASLHCLYLSLYKIWLPSVMIKLNDYTFYIPNIAATLNVMIEIAGSLDIHIKSLYHLCIVTQNAT